MSIPKQTERLREVHARAIKRFNDAESVLRDERMQCLKDRRFYSIAGAQWEGPVGEQFANKPRYEMNKVHLAVIRIINEYRNNRITVDFTTKDGSDDDTMADTCDGLYRADEKDSGAQEAYDNAFEEGVGGGYGAARLRTRYEDEYDEENTRQRIGIELITDADSCVYFDLDAKRQDKADAKWGCVLTGMTIDAYMDEYGDDPANWPKSVQQSEFDWSTPDLVYVAEYYEIEEKTEVVHFFEGISITDEPGPEKRFTDEELEKEGLLEELLATGFREVRQKRIKCAKVHKYQMNGAYVLADEGFIAGKCIPIVPMFGKRWVVDGVERCMGHVRLAKDAQMLYNMLMSWLAEMAGRFDIEKPIFTPEQVAGHATMWARDNVEKFPYLLVNPITDAEGNQIPSGPIAYTKSPVMPQAMAALMQIAGEALQELLGNQQAGEEVQANVSGKVIELVQNRLDMQAFIYMSNMGKFVKRAGEIWLSMAREVYVEEGRKMKTISADGATGTVELQRPMTDKNGNSYLENDLSKANFDVDVDVGPSSSSRRSSTVRSLSALLQTTTDPETRTVLESMIMLNMEGEGLQDVRDYFRAKLVRMGVVKPTEKEKEQLAEAEKNAQPDPNAIYLQAAGEKALADAALSQAKVGESHAKTLETLASIESTQLADTIALADALTPGPVLEKAAPAQEVPEMAPAGAPQQ